ncbi:hypothetical protein SAMN05444672_104241 [Bacillus sp. OK838]|nr:hypothetical protein SAMN05444672_104241 [Bacillus sp. OK838]
MGGNMSKLDFQANSVQMMAQTKLPLRQGQLTQQGFNSIFNQLFPLMKN